MGERRGGTARLGLAAGMALALSACAGVVVPLDPRDPEAVAESDTVAVLVGAGDIGDCQSPGDEATARLLDSIPGIVFTTGDNAYSAGTPAQFQACYHPSWGRHRSRTLPTPGNHDNRTALAGYMGYFRDQLERYGESATDPRRAWYAYKAGSWQVIALNSTLPTDTAQLAWLRSLLERPGRSRCTLAYFHHPRYSSGIHGNVGAMQAIWETLHRHGVDVVVAGHDHHYERFARLDAAGRPDPARGIRSFVVGTGGTGLRIMLRRKPGSEVRTDDHWGVIKLVLRPGRYSWEFIPATGPRKAIDYGAEECHD